MEGAGNLGEVADESPVEVHKPYEGLDILDLRWLWPVCDSLDFNRVHLSGCVQDWERTRCLGTCGAPTYLQGVTQGEWVPAECLSRSVIRMYKSKYIHEGLYLSRSKKKAAFSSYSSPTLYNGWVTWRKELNKKAVTHY